MQQMMKTRQRTKRVVELSELSVPTASLSDTTEAGELLAEIDELLRGL